MKKFFQSAVLAQKPTKKAGQINPAYQLCHSVWGVFNPL
jgi:hypothetical protein